MSESVLMNLHLWFQPFVEIPLTSDNIFLARRTQFY